MTIDINTKKKKSRSDSKFIRKQLMKEMKF